jgi:hypothetical protein
MLAGHDGPMLQWWLNAKWLAEAHADRLARLNFALVVVGVAALTAYLLTP